MQNNTQSTFQKASCLNLAFDAVNLTNSDAIINYIGFIVWEMPSSFIAIETPAVVSRYQLSDACKYGRKSSLLGSRSSEKIPVKINRLKPSKSFEKTPVKISALKPSRAFDKSPGLLKLKTSKSDSCSKVLNVARDTCSSNCKHVVKGGDLTFSPEPRCPYHYCSLNHLDRVEPPSVKQFLASRRRLLRTQKSFKWVGLTPVAKGSGVGANSVADIVIDSGHGVDIDSVVDTGQGLFFVGCGDVKREEDAAEVWNKLDDNPRPEDCQIVDCDDYDDDGLLLESGDSHGNHGISTGEISMAESEIKMETDRLSFTTCNTSKGKLITNSYSSKISFDILVKH